MMDVIILGSNVGTASEWDQSNDWGVIFYDYTPNDLGRSLFGVLPCNDLSVDFETGIAELYDDEGTVLNTVQLRPTK